MKIKRVTIDSFGGVQRFSSPELSENMNLVYGPNESGKSTITEFIRSTLFPSRFKYPVAAKTDSGSIEIVMDNGEERTLLREQKKVREKDGNKTVEEEFPGLDAETYRSLYGLDLNRLTDEKVLSSHDFKTRFLTVPGGEHVPAVAEEIEASLDELMTRDRMSEKTMIGGKLRDIRECDAELSEIRQLMDSFEIKATEKRLLESKIEEKKKLEIMNKDSETKEIVMNAQKKNIETLRELQAQRTNIERYRNFPLGAKTQYDAIQANLDEIQKKLDEIPFGTQEESEILSKSADIQSAWDSRPEYISNLARIEQLDERIDVLKKEIYVLEEKSGYSVERSRKLRVGPTINDMATTEIMNRRRSNLSVFQRRALGLMVIIGIVGALAGLYLTMNQNETGIILAITGGIIFVLGCLIPVYVKPSSKEIGDWDSWIVSQGYPEKTTPEEALDISQKIDMMNSKLKVLTTVRDERAVLVEKVNDYEASIKPVLVQFGYSSVSVADDLADLLKVLRTVEERKRTKPTTELESEYEYKAKELNELMKKFGGEKEFLRQYELKVEIDRLDNEIRTLTESIESSSGVSVGELMMFLDGISEDHVPIAESYDTDEMNQRLGQLQAEMGALADDTRVHQIMQKKLNQENDLSIMLREWAVNAIARDLVANACAHFYSDLEPDVIKTANRYLNIMTDGRYKLDSDPRDKNLTVRDDYMKKSSNQWSSGLGDQIYLSIKMAMAKEMGTEKMPMLLDDVLVRFDADRKQSACRAIFEFAKDNQVIMFSCDNSLRNYFSMCGSFTEVRL